MNLSFINDKLQTAKITLDVFGALKGSIGEQLEELKGLFNLMAKTVHPDRYTLELDKKTAHEAFISLNNWYELAIKDIEGKTYGQRQTTKIKSKKNTYIVHDQFRTGDVSDIFNIVNEKNPSKPLVLKVANDASNNDLVNNEIKVLKKLYSHTDKLLNLITNHTCAPIEVFEAEGKQSIVFEKLEGFYTLEEVIKRYPEGVDPKTMAWIFRRMLAVQAAIHDLGLVHANIIPSNFMICPENHNGKLIDFTGTVEVGQKAKLVIPEYRDFYAPEVLNKGKILPTTDIYMTAMNMIKLLGGDVKTKEMPNTVPTKIKNFIKSCLIENPYRRPDSALRIHKDFGEVLGELWGKPSFHKFVMSP